MAIGINWSEVWDSAWNPVWRQAVGGPQQPIGINWEPIWKYSAWDPVWRQAAEEPPVVPPPPLSDRSVWRVFPPS